MKIFISHLTPFLVGLSLTLFTPTATLAEPTVDALAAAVSEVEADLGARVGVSLTDTGSQMVWQHRENERFLMNSTVKVPICAAALERRDAGQLSLSETIAIEAEDILSYAPVTKVRVGTEMNLSELCLASIDMSDNTAANLLIERLGGPQAVTDFLRSSGDMTSRLDRTEPTLNTFAPNDPRDTTTPGAMSQTLQGLLLGEVLSEKSQAQLADWMRTGSVTKSLLRADALPGWEILDKSGSGSHTRNIIAVVTPKGRAPWIVTLFVSDVDVDFKTRNKALQKLTRAVMAVIKG